MRKKQRGLAGFVLGIFMLGVLVLPGWAAEPEQPTEAETAPPVQERTMTLEEAVAYAQEHSLLIKQAEAQSQLTNIAYQQARAAARNISKTTTFIERYTRDVAPQIAELNLEYVDKVKASTVNMILLQVERAYYAVINAEEALAIGQRSLARAEEQLRLTDLRLQAGTASQIEVKQAEAAVIGSQTLVIALSNTLNQMRRELNAALVLDNDIIIHTVGGAKFVPERYDLSVLLAKALAEDYNLLKAEIDFQSADLAATLLNYYYGNIWDTRNAQAQRSLAETNLERIRTNLDNSVRTTYETYLTVGAQYESYTKIVELQAEAYRLQQLKYEVGMSTFEEVNRSADALKAAEADVTACVYNHNLLKTAMKYNIYI